MLLEQEGWSRCGPASSRWPPSPGRVREIYEVRQHLLTLVGRLVTYRATDAELDDLRAASP